jgi:hypothetical protein
MDGGYWRMYHWFILPHYSIILGKYLGCILFRGSKFLVQKSAQ